VVDLLEGNEQMTIDERIEKLTERHEALTQTVEMLARDIVELRTFQVETTKQVLALLAIAEMHQKRLNDLQGGSQ
jgi:archaellum component FlaC